MDKANGEEILHIDRKIKKPTKFNTVNKLNRTLEPFQDDEYNLGTKAKLCSGMVSRSDEDGFCLRCRSSAASAPTCSRAR